VQNSGVTLSLPPVRDPDAQALVSAILTLGQPSLGERGVEGARQYLQERADAATPGPELFSVEDHRVPAGEPVRVYRATQSSDRPVVVYFHGGGWVIGSVAASDAFCRRLSAGADCVVISVEYPLAPESPFPLAIDAAVAAIEWSAARSSEWGGDPERLIVLGDSAGGNVATVALRRIVASTPELVCRQILAYPGTAAERATDGGHFGHEWPLTNSDRTWCMNQYVTDETMRSNPDVAPLLADLADLGALPATTVLLSGCDPLLKEGLEYANRLWSAGVSVDLHVYAGQIHGFLTLDPAVLPRAEEALGLVVNAVLHA
jgi:acetyl esterase